MRRELAGDDFERVGKNISFTGADDYILAATTPEGGEQHFARRRAKSLEGPYARIHGRSCLEEVPGAVRRPAILDHKFEIVAGLGVYRRNGLSRGLQPVSAVPDNRKERATGAIGRRCNELVFPNCSLA